MTTEHGKNDGGHCMDDAPTTPGFFELDTVAHCGPTLRGEFARTLNLACVFSGWGFTASMRNNASKWVLETMDTAVETIPFAVVGLDFDYADLWPDSCHLLGVEKVKCLWLGCLPVHGGRIGH